MTKESIIPDQLRRQEFRFIRVDGEKRAIDKGFQRVNNYLHDEEDFQNYISKYKRYGVLGGYGNLMITDFDQEIIQDDVMPKLPETFTQKSAGKGLYHLFYYVDKPKGFRVKDLEGKTLADVQGEGTYIIGPNSVMPNGRKYEIVKDVPIAKTTLAEIEKAFSKWRKIDKVVDKSGVMGKDPDTQKIIDSITIPEMLRGLNIPTNKNPTECPFHESSGRKCFSYTDKLWNCFHCGKGGTVIQLVMGVKDVDYFGAMKILSEELDIELESEDIWTVNPETGYRKLDHNKAAEYLIKKYPTITIGKIKKSSYVYDGKMYQKNGETFLETVIETIARGCCKSHEVSEIIKKVQRITYQDEAVLYSAPKNLINCDNGVYNLDTKQLIEHSPDVIFTNIVPHDFDEKKDCPGIKKFINKMNLGDDDVDLIQEWTGFILYRKYFLKKSLILVGEKDTGKTTLIDLIVELVGLNNTSGVSLHKLLNDRFAASSMQHKLLNFYDDLSFKDIKQTGAFKIATGGGYLSAEEKFGECFNFRNYAKLMFATNKISGVDDADDDAYYDRWLIIFCNNVIKKEDQNPHLREQLSTAEEMGGFLNWALEGLQRVLDKESFSYSKSSAENKIVMERNSSSISAFAQDVLSDAPGLWISKGNMYLLYSAYCKKTGFNRVTKDKFGKSLMTKCEYITDATGKNKEKKSIRVWVNVAVDKDDGFKNILLYIKNTPLNSKLCGCISVLNMLNSKMSSLSTCEGDVDSAQETLETPTCPPEKNPCPPDPKVRHYEKLLKYIKKMAPRSVTESELKSLGLDEDKMYEWLEELAKKGEIYTPEPLTWRLLE